MKRFWKVLKQNVRRMIEGSQELRVVSEDFTQHHHPDIGLHSLKMQVLSRSSTHRGCASLEFLLKCRQYYLYRKRLLELCLCCQFHPRQCSWKDLLARAYLNPKKTSSYTFICFLPNSAIPLHHMLPDETSKLSKKNYRHWCDRSGEFHFWVTKTGRSFPLYGRW